MTITDPCSSARNESCGPVTRLMICIGPHVVVAPARAAPVCSSRGGNYNQSCCNPPASYLSKLAGGGGLGQGGGRRKGGGEVLVAQGGGSEEGGGLRATHYCHMHTSRVCVCLGAWGYRGMYAIIAISRFCREESLKGLKDQRHSTPFNKAWDKKFGAVGAMAPAPLSFKTRGGGAGGGGVAYKDRARSPPPGAHVSVCSHCYAMTFLIAVVGCDSMGYH